MTASHQHTDTAEAAPTAAMRAGLHKALYRIPEAMELLSLSRTVIYEQIRAGRLRTVREGRARRVPAAAIAEYVALLERESRTGRAA